ncbi:MAG: DUF1232 domain-containing protein [Rhizobiales bacterium]|nr:DUF1232 domain-containing protein [Hyphomicrobiales bacterium]
MIGAIYRRVRFGVEEALVGRNGETWNQTWDKTWDQTWHGQAWDDLGPQEARKAAADEATVRKGFWAKLRGLAANLPFAEDLLAAYYCAFDRDTPLHVKAALLGALAYFVLPFDFVPDILPVLGYADDAAVLATAVRLVAAHMRPAHREAARRALEREFAA